MKSEDLQQIVLSKLRNGQFPTQISRNLNGMVSTSTIERWSRMYRETGAIELSHPPGPSRTVRTTTAANKVKRWLNAKKKKSVRILARKLHVGRESVRKIIKLDLLCKPYKVCKQPKLTEGHKIRRVQFSNWIRNNFKKSDTSRIVFSDEKLFSVDGVWNRQNERVWAVNREAANQVGGLRGVSKFPGKIMVWLAACASGISKVVFLESGTINQDKYTSKRYFRSLGDLATSNWERTGGFSKTEHVLIRPPEVKIGARKIYLILSKRTVGQQTVRI